MAEENKAGGEGETGKPDKKEKPEGEAKKTLGETGDGKPGTGDGEAAEDTPGDGEAGAGEGGEGESGADDWRTRLAAGDDKALAFFNRFTDEGALGRHIMGLEKRVREKGGIVPPKADAPPEEKAKFYTEHFGRPEKAEDITIEPKLPEGEELSSDEMTTLKGVSALLHAQGIFGAEQMAAAHQIFADLAVGGRAEAEKVAEAARTKAEEMLKARENWGRDYDANLGFAVRYMSMRCEEAGVDRDALARTRLSDGSYLGDNPLFLKVMALGGRDVGAEDPRMNREEGGGARTADIEEALNKEMAKRNGSAAERKYYDSAEGKARREKLRKDLNRMGGATRAKKR